MIVVNAPSHRVFVFGAGLIGNAVLDAMRLRAPLDLQFRPLSWSGTTLRTIQLATIERDAIDAATSGSRVSILWSAGRAGFTAGEAETACELAMYRDVLRMSARLARRFDGVAFHLVSSAGGLFEGQRRVTRDAMPRPQRPYGRLKLQQEQLLLDESPFASRRIYRVSSAYGPLRVNVRAGLVSTLLLSAARREVTQITGRMETLRDFVFSGDLGTHIAEAILENRQRNDVVVLASGRPCSLLEAQAIVERAVGRKLLVAYARDAENAEDITFDASALPPRWEASDLRWNVERIYRDAVSAGIVDAAPAARLPIAARP
jgi:nucleoside-diphosphate-sugar epimerase